MYCGKCGAKNEPGAAFCGACGAPLEGGTKPDRNAVAGGKPAASVKPAAVQSSHKNKKVGIAAVVVVAVIAIVAVSSLFGGRSDIKTAKQFVDAAFDADPAAIVNLVPKKLVNAVMEQGGYTKEEVAEELEYLADELESTFGTLDFLGNEVKISYDTVRSEDVDADQLSYLQEQYKQFDVDVSAARAVSIAFRVQADSYGIDETTPFDIPVVKVGNSWYIDVVSLS
jgi:uncharacterized membrane protein YvbJ